MSPDTPSDRPPVGGLSRRHFLLQSAGLALGVGQRPRVGAESVVRVGFVGLGDRGRRLLGAVARRARQPGAPAVRVVALADVQPASLRRAREILGTESGADPTPRLLRDARSLVDDTDVDAVFLATPVHLHASLAVEALAAGKHLYCEKPMAPTASESARILSAARAAASRGVAFRVGLQRRHSPRYLASLRFLRSGEAGRVLCLRAQWHTVAGGPTQKPWLLRRESSGGPVVEQACHQLDVFNWVFDAAPLRAWGAGGASDPAGSTESALSHAGVVLEYPGGGRVYFTQLDFAIPDRRFSGVYELAFAERAGVDLGRATVYPRTGASRELVAAAGDETELAVESFLRLVSGNAPGGVGIGSDEGGAGAEIGHRATLAALLCQRAIDLGRCVAWSEIDVA